MMVRFSFFADAERAGDVEIPTLAEDGHNGSARADQRLNVAVFLNGILREAGGAEGRHSGVTEFQAARPLEEVFVFGIGAGPAAFNVVDAQLVEFLANEDFVLDRERDGFALRAVPESGIESLNAHSKLSLSCSRAFARPTG